MSCEVLQVASEVGLSSDRRRPSARRNAINREFPVPGRITRLRDLILRWYMQTPDHPTKYRMVRWLGRNVFPAKGIKFPVLPDLYLFLHPRDWVEYWLLAGNEYEPLTLDFIARNLQPPQRAVFAGVNFGLHVIAAAQAVGGTGKIIGIEPQPSALLRARMNLELNRLSDRVQLISAALGSSDGYAHMAWSRPDENAGAANLFDEGEGFTVRLIPLGEVLRTAADSGVQLVLLDVEGYEVNVLRGLSPKCAPKIIIVEVQPEFLRRAGSSEEELFRTLRSFQYRLYTLTGAPVTAAGANLLENNVVGILNDVEPTWAASN